MGQFIITSTNHAAPSEGIVAAADTRRPPGDAARSQLAEGAARRCSGGRRVDDMAQLRKLTLDHPLDTAQLRLEPAEL